VVVFAKIIMSLDLRSNDYRIINLTEFGLPGNTTEEESEDLVICSHCDKAMTLAYQDIISYPSNLVLVKKDQFYCEYCGLIKAPDANLLTKKREQKDPKISKSKGNSLAFVFENIRFNQESQREKELDIEPEDEERLKAEGCTIKETRVTSAETVNSISKKCVISWSIKQMDQVSIMIYLIVVRSANIAGLT
jgi:hypothetical protein